MCYASTESRCGIARSTFEGLPSGTMRLAKRSSGAIGCASCSRPDAVDSKWVKREVHYALRNDRYENRLIPLVAKKCDVDELSWVLSGLQTITLSGRWKKGVRELLAVWGLKP